MVVAVGFEPTKHMQAILSRSPLTAREHYLCTSCGIWTHNPQIRSLMRYPIAPMRQSSHTGTRTRVGWVKTSYPNHLDYMGITGNTFSPGFIKVITPSPPAGFEPATYRLTAERSANWAIEECIWGRIWTFEAYTPVLKYRFLWPLGYPY